MSIPKRVLALDLLLSQASHTKSVWYASTSGWLQYQQVGESNLNIYVGMWKSIRGWLVLGTGGS